jgi:hypothetical protein
VKPAPTNGDPHGLLLKQRQAQRPAKNLLQLGLRVNDGLKAFAPAKIGMHHVGLDRRRTIATSITRS